MDGAIPHLPLYAFTAWIVVTLPFCYIRFSWQRVVPDDENNFEYKSLLHHETGYGQIATGLDAETCPSKCMEGLQDCLGYS